jgi:protein subunit release factor A
MEEDNQEQGATPTGDKSGANHTPTHPARFVIPKDDEALLAECDTQVFRGSGPGGQSVNTTDSAVRLTHRPSGIVVVAREERSQYRNKRIALARLRKRLEAANHTPRKRKPTRPTKAAQARRRATKAHTSQAKHLRKRPDAAEE